MYFALAARSCFRNQAIPYLSMKERLHRLMGSFESINYWKDCNEVNSTNGKGTCLLLENPVKAPGIVRYLNKMGMINGK